VTRTWGFASTISEKTRSIKALKCTRFSGEGPRLRTLRRFRAHWSKKFLLLFFLNSKEAETSRHKINERMRACILTVKAPQHIGKGQRIKPPRLSLFILFWTCGTYLKWSWWAARRQPAAAEAHSPAEAYCSEGRRPAHGGELHEGLWKLRWAAKPRGGAIRRLSWACKNILIVLDEKIPHTKVSCVD